MLDVEAHILRRFTCTETAGDMLKLEQDSHI